MSNDTRLNEPLRQVAEETFESLAFMFAMPGDDEFGPDPDAPLAVARVSFHGPFAGELHLGVSRDMLPDLAANMLGMDEQATAPTPEQQADALRELLNVVCGNLLPAIAGAEAVFNV